ncbi:LamG domain-containing protein [Marinicrinis lubricantis]
MNHDTMLWSGTAWYDAGTGMKMEEGEWTHLAFAVDQGSVTVYVDGEAKYNGSGFPNVFTTASGTFSLGVNWWDPAFVGKMDELLIFTEALSADRVSELAAAAPNS